MSTFVELDLKNKEEFREGKKTIPNGVGFEVRVEIDYLLEN